MPLHLTEKERSTLAAILALLALGLIGMVLIDEEPPAPTETAGPRESAGAGRP